LNLLRTLLRSRLNLLFALLVILTVALADTLPAATQTCAGGLSGTITSYSDATYTTVVGTCRKLCCWDHWVCSGTTTIYRIEDTYICIPPSPQG